MSKITFRADEDLVERLEAFEASKSEVMREALRAYLDAEGPEGSTAAADGAVDDLDDALAARVDQLVEERLDGTADAARDVNVNLTIEGAGVVAEGDGTGEPEAATGAAADPTRKTDDAGLATKVPRDCAQCGESLAAEDVYCPNCGEKAAHRAFCECGDELRSDWAFCPGCGRRTPAADVLDST